MEREVLDHRGCLRDHRFDTSLVQLLSWTQVGAEDRATNSLKQFVAVFYPTLKNTLPSL